MGRHSAPDNADDHSAPGGAGHDDDGGSGLAVATHTVGRHTGDGGARPRPVPESGLDLIDDALEQDTAEIPGPVAEPPPGPMVIVDAETAEAVLLEPIDEPLAEDPPSAEALTTEIPLAEIARHDRPLPEETTARIAPVVEPVESPVELPAAPPITAPSPAPASRGGGHATRHDLALVRNHGDVRARALAAVLVPFVVYVVVLVVLGSLTVHNLIWIWIPAIVAGVLVGLVLDAGHRHYPGAADEPSPVTAPADPG